jgi:hypothetical protein
MKARHLPFRISSAYFRSLLWSDRGNSTSRRSKGLLGSVSLVAALFLANVSSIGPARVAQAQQKYSKDNGYFYRFRASFEIKGTGEKLDFDYVVACNIRLTRWRDGGLSDDTSYSPRAMFKATAGSHAVMLGTLDACHGLTSEHEDVPKDILPLAIWFEDVSNLSTGLGYVSQDAYDNPLGRLIFHGARVDRATHDDWEAWRKKSASEYMQRGVLPGPWGYDLPNIPVSDTAFRSAYVSECNGYRRLKLPQDMRAKLRVFWPADRPRFWTSSSEEERSTIGDVIADPSQPLPPSLGNWSLRFIQSRAGGLPVRSGRQVSSSLNADGSRRAHVPSVWPAENYPFLWPPLTSILPVTRSAMNPAPDTYAEKLEFREGALNGFAACQNLSDARGYTVRSEDPQWMTRRHVFEVDGVIVKELSQRTPAMGRPQYVAERDEAVFVHFSVLF